MPFNRGKQESRLKVTLLASSCLVSALAIAQPAAANPSGATVAAGQAVVSQTAQSTLVQQSSQKAVITWQNLSLASGQSLTFAQPNAQSFTLNRVLSNSTSFINGNLSANGQILIINPNGVMFGAGAQVNVGGLIASTTDIRDQDFMSGLFKFSQPSANANASIVNLGHITALDGGSVVLAGNSVSNEGVIQANLGSVVLAGAKTYTVDFYGDKLLSFAIDGGVDTLPKDANGNPVGWLVSNSGTIAAQGGQVTMTARAANQVLDHLINMSGQIQATGVSVKGGTVVLDAGDGGDIDVSGKIDASGSVGGGSVKIGSATAGTVTIENGAVISATGTGGMVETSGHDLKLGKATINAASWLIDPVDFDIDSTAAAIINTALGLGSSITISAGAAAACVPVSACSATSTATGTAGDIIVDSAIGWTGAGGALTLDAANNIVFNQSISHGGSVPANLTLITGDTAGTGTSSGGNYLFNSGSHISLASGDSLHINGQNYLLVTAANQFSGLTGTDNYALAGNLSGVTAGFSGNYSGIFVGLGNSVNLALSASGVTGAGMFGTVSGTVRDLTLDGTMAVSAVTTAGALAGVISSSGTVSNVASSVFITGTGANSTVGGLIGADQGTVSGISMLSGSGVSTGTASATIGGVVGDLSASLSYRSLAVTVNAGNSSSVIGGVAGSLDGSASLTNEVPTATASVSMTLGAGVQNVGGMIGTAFGSGIVDQANLQISLSTGDNSSFIGGVAGY
ncbi:MAG TPA: filamentous hemagglutinin N-terminal domain-containing protein, partial [Magnetospirillaceae bacterium]|nr:filamentous hemagglutinin N-terminal domain-containing protein [Magnetospirillaceae bacterium]